MEKTNFKSKKTNVVIDQESYDKLPSTEKDLFYLTSETPTHKVELEDKKPFIAPIIAQEEVAKVANVGETPTDSIVVTKKNKAKGEPK